VFRAKGLLTARFVAELTKGELYRKRKRKESFRIVTNTLRIFLFLVIILFGITTYLSLGHYSFKLSSYKMVSMHLIIRIKTCIKLQFFFLLVLFSKLIFRSFIFIIKLAANYTRA